MVGGGRDRVDDGVDGAEIGIPGVGRRRPDGDEQQPRVLEGVADVRREVHPIAVGGDHLGQSRLVDRDLARLQAGDLVRIDVDAVDLAAEVGEARGGDEADVAGADDTDGLATAGHAAQQVTGLYCPIRCSDRAMSIICLFVRRRDSVLETQ